MHTGFVSTVFLLSCLVFGLRPTDDRLSAGWAAWRNGHIAEALEHATAALGKQPSHPEALHLHGNALFVQGKYREALGSFSRILATGYGKRREVSRAMIDAYLHLGDFEGAVRLARESQPDNLPVLEAWASNPLIVEADKTVVLPFVADSRVPLTFWPGISGKVNGQAMTVMFDTGAPFIVMGKDRAAALGIKVLGSHAGKQATRDVMVGEGLAERVEIGDDIVLKNVPVSIMPKLDWVIFGTSLLERFFTTVDYPNSRFILTPRARPDLLAAHRAMLLPRQVKMLFYLWGDHYMFGKGVFGNVTGLNFFFDSGLIALKRSQGKLVQASFAASKERLIAWDFPETELAATRFFESSNALGIPGLLQDSPLIHYDAGLPKDRVFGGIRMDGLISHAWLSHYSWTLDFDSREYTFGVP